MSKYDCSLQKHRSSVVGLASLIAPDRYRSCCVVQLLRCWCLQQYWARACECLFCERFVCGTRLLDTNVVCWLVVRPIYTMLSLDWTLICRTLLFYPHFRLICSHSKNMHFLHSHYTRPQRTRSDDDCLSLAVLDKCLPVHWLLVHRPPACGCLNCQSPAHHVRS